MKENRFVRSDLEAFRFTLQPFFDGLPQPVVVFGDRETIVYANPRAEAAFGKRMKDLGTGGCPDFLSCCGTGPSASKELSGCRDCSFSEAVRKALASPGKSQEGEFAVYQEADFEPAWIQYRVGTVSLNGAAAAVAVLDEITERKAAQEREAYIKKVLLAIRNVNQLITAETDRNRLIERACRMMTETLGYYNVWIALADGRASPARAAAASRLDGAMRVLKEDLLKGRFPGCAMQALNQESLVVTRDPSAECPDCPVAKQYTGCAGLAHCLDFGGRVYGVICASVPGPYAEDTEAQALFKELAEDLGFGLSRIEAAAVLKEREAELSAVFESVPVVMILVDGDRRIRRANRKILEYTDRSAGEMIGMRGGEALRCIHALDDPKGCGFGPACEACVVRRAVVDAIETGKSYFQLEARLTLSRGESNEDLHLLVSATPITGPEERVALVCIEDITGHKRAEEEKARLQEQFHQAQKLESIGRLAGGVAHDLNNVLTPILGYGEMLLDGASGEDPRREPLEEIVDAGRRARNLVHQLLAFSRKQLLEIKTLDLNALLKNFERLLRRTIRENIDIRLILEKSLPPVRGDTGQLEQVVMNLAVNAQDAMPEGGTLTVETVRVDLDEACTSRHEGIRPGPHVLMALSDTGSGMDEETRRSLFEPFFTTKEKEKGTGLGLATVYGIVRQHGGSVRVYSEPGLGTVFKVYLPAAVGEAAVPAEEKRQVHPAEGGSETILLAEDNPQVKNLAAAILERRGYTILSAESGLEAVSIIKKHNGPVHLLLTDVIMPDMNGRKLFEKVRRIHPDIRVLYMSGYTDNVIAHHGVVDPDVHFIHKPFPVNALAAKVREVLKK